MTDKVFVLREPNDLFCRHFFRSPEAAIQWARATYPSAKFFLVLSEAPDAVVNPIYVVELSQPPFP